jgi:ribose transport system substrate-binding protein
MRESNVVNRSKVLAVVLALGLVICAACSSDSPSAKSNGSQASGVPASDTSSGSAAVQAALNAPTALPVTEPLRQAPPKGETVAWLECELPGCKADGDGIRAAADALGWTVKTVPFKTSDPASLVNGMESALQYHPVATFIVALPQAVWQAAIPDYKAAGVPIIPFTVGPIDINDTVIAGVGTPNDSKNRASLLADWIIGDSGGQAHVLYTDVPEFGVLAAYKSGLESTFGNCSGCKLTTVTMTTNDLSSGNIPTLITSALRADPSIKYLVVPVDTFLTGVPAALGAAGLSVKITGEGASRSDQPSIVDGTYSTFTSVPFELAGWAGIDVALRHMQGMDVSVWQGRLPTMLVTAANVGQLNSNTSEFGYNVPLDYKGQFRALWKLS